MARLLEKKAKGSGVFWLVRESRPSSIRAMTTSPLTGAPLLSVSRTFTGRLVLGSTFSGASTARPMRAAA